MQTLQSGQPFTVTSDTDTNRDGTNNDRVNLVGDPYTHAGSRQTKIGQYLNPAGFSVPGFATVADNPYGTEQRDSLTGPEFINTNLSLFKTFCYLQTASLSVPRGSLQLNWNVNLAAPSLNLSVFRTLTQGNIIATQNDSRIFQFAGKLFF